MIILPQIVQLQPSRPHNKPRVGDHVWSIALHISPKSSGWNLYIHRVEPPNVHMQIVTEIWAIFWLTHARTQNGYHGDLGTCEFTQLTWRTLHLCAQSHVIARGDLKHTLSAVLFPSLKLKRVHHTSRFCRNACTHPKILQVISLLPNQPTCQRWELHCSTWQNIEWAWYCPQQHKPQSHDCVKTTKSCLWDTTDTHQGLIIPYCALCVFCKGCGIRIRGTGSHLLVAACCPRHSLHIPSPKHTSDLSIMCPNFHKWTRVNLLMHTPYGFRRYDC